MKITFHTFIKKKNLEKTQMSPFYWYDNIDKY